MTRSTIRLAQICAGAIGAGILLAALAQSTAAGLTYTDRLLAVVGAAGAVASFGWHGVRFGFLRYEEHLQAKRRHRAPKPERGVWRPPAGPEQEESVSGPEPEAQRDPEHRRVPGAPGPASAPLRDPAFQDMLRHQSDPLNPYVTRPASRDWPEAPGWRSATEGGQYEDLYAHRSPSST